jgi:hypothetical protein
VPALVQPSFYPLPRARRRCFSAFLDPASSSANFSNRRPFAEIGPRGFEHIACRFRPAHGMRMLLTRAGAKTHEEGHPPVDLFSSAMALGRRIVAMAASYAAKGFGIKTGTLVREAPTPVPRHHPGAGQSPALHRLPRPHSRSRRHLPAGRKGVFDRRNGLLSDGQRAADAGSPALKVKQALGDQLGAKSAEADRKVVDRVAEVAAARGIPRAQVALAGLLSKPVITAPIVGATKLHHLDDALASVNVKLSADEITSLVEPYVPHAVIGFA